MSPREEYGWSLLDRLLYVESLEGDFLPEERLVHSIARDLQTLMNSRRKDDESFVEFPEVSRSILNFGLPAFGRYGHIGTTAEQSRLCRSMEDAIRMFEPRLKKPEVRLVEADSRRKDVVCFRIDANIEGLGTREVFEMRLKPETGELVVSPGGAG